MSEGKAVIEDRGKIRGKYSEQSTIAQMIKGVFRGRVGRTRWAELSHSQRESLDNISNKLARILTGDPNEIDSWADISGYAELAIRAIKQEYHDKRNAEEEAKRK